MKKNKNVIIVFLGFAVICFSLYISLYFKKATESLTEQNSKKEFLVRTTEPLTSTENISIKLKEEPLRANTLVTATTINGDQSSAFQNDHQSDGNNNKTNSTVQNKIIYFFDNIPKTSSLKSLSEEEIHSAPEATLEAGRYLAEMRDFFLAEPHSAEVELDFYLRCANETDLMDSIRSVCAARASQNFKQLTGKVISPKVFDSRIARLKDLVQL